MSEGTVAESERPIGTTTTAYDGTMLHSRQWVAKDLAFDMTPQLLADGYAWEQMIRGSGHVWGFEGYGLYSSKGLAPTAGYSILFDTANPKFGSYRLYTDASITWRVGNYGTQATILFWRISPTASTTWEHWCYMGDGTVYKNGALITLPQPFIQTYFGDPNGDFSLHAPQDNATAWAATTVTTLGTIRRPTVRNGYTYICTTAGTTGGSQPTWSTVLGNTTADGSVVWTTQLGVGYFDDVVFLPYVIPTSWIAYLAAATAPWADTPWLYMVGDALSEGSRNMIGSCSSKMVRGVLSGSFRTNLKALSVSLSQT